MHNNKIKKITIILKILIQIAEMNNNNIPKMMIETIIHELMIICRIVIIIISHGQIIKII